MAERFAPSPTGHLHLGHAFSALTVWDNAQASGQPFLLRVEDIDHTRCRAEFEASTLDDLRWLGLRWPTPLMRQSERLNAYKSALNTLINNNLCYPCNCTRADIKNAISAPQEGDAAPSKPPTYPGTCRNRAMNTATDMDSIRLDMAKAIAFLGGTAAVKSLSFTETSGATPVIHPLNTDTLIHQHGDIILSRKDLGTSYHLAVVVDDAAQDISQVTRGRDIFEATEIHRALQALLSLPTPTYHHHRLIRDETGKRLAKRDDARAIGKFRLDGATPQDIRALVGL